VSPKPTHPRDSRAAAPVSDWRVFRPAIWVGFVGVAVMLVFSFYIGLAIVGGAIGMGARIRTSRRRLAQGLPARRSSRSGRSGRSGRSRRSRRSGR
jgi:uncharacterized membrane protein